MNMLNGMSKNLQEKKMFTIHVRNPNWNIDIHMFEGGGGGDHCNKLLPIVYEGWMSAMIVMDYLILNLDWNNDKTYIDVVWNINLRN